MATAAETLLIGVLVCAASVPIVTALAAAGAGSAALAEFADSGTPVRVRRFASLVRAALADPVAWVVPPVLVVVGVLDTLAVAGGLPGRAAMGPVLALVGAAAIIVCTAAAARWRPGIGWSRALMEGADACVGDPAGSVLMLGALAVVVLVTSAEPAFVVIAPGLVLLAAVAVHRRRSI
ncbi:MAG: hypothetical protein HOW97_16745 [Catenulispora sp.]|nr:hypothetical protein [Catenulispora sp.]